MKTHPDLGVKIGGYFAGIFPKKPQIYEFWIAIKSGRLIRRFPEDEYGSRSPIRPYFPWGRWDQTHRGSIDLCSTRGVPRGNGILTDALSVSRYCVHYLAIHTKNAIEAGDPERSDRCGPQRSVSSSAAGHRLWWSGIICLSFWMRLRRGSEQEINCRFFKDTGIIR